MIGLSLGLCIADVCEGKIKLKDVEKIISGLICRDETAWDNVIEQYKKNTGLNTRNKQKRLRGNY